MPKVYTLGVMLSSTFAIPALPAVLASPPFLLALFKVAVSTKALKVPQVKHRAAVIQGYPMVNLKVSGPSTLHTGPAVTVQRQEPDSPPTAVVGPLTTLAPTHPASPRDRTAVFFGFRASAPAASTRPWATSSRLVLLVPFFTRRTFP